MRLLTGSLLVVAATAVVLLNLVSATLLKGMHIDITQGRFYTLSKGTKEILANLEEPLTLRLYFSKTALQANHYLQNYAARVITMLEQYQRTSDGKIRLEIIDPKPYSDDLEAAANYGLQGITVGDQEVFFGLVGTNALDAQQVIPIFMPNREGNLEYDLSQLIDNLTDPQARIVGVMSALPLNGVAGKPWAIRQAIDRAFVIKDIDVKEPNIPGYLSILMVVDPSEFSDAALRAIDLFVQNGGRVLMFVDPYSELAGKVTGAGNATQLLQAWGVEMLADKVVADRKLGRAVRMQHEGRDLTANYPLWMDFTQKNFNQDDVVTGVLDRLTMASPGALKPIADASTYFMPLIKTSDEAMLLTSKTVPDTQTDFAKFANEYQAEGQYTVAARISGPVRSPYTQELIDQTSIIIVADADMLYDHFWMSTQNIFGNNYEVASSGNGNFVLSALDNLLGCNQLIQIRNRGVFSRPFAKLQDLAEQARAKALADDLDSRQAQQGLQSQIMRLKYLIEFFSFGLLPILIAAGGLYVYIRGYRRKKWQTQ